MTSYTFTEAAAIELSEVFPDIVFGAPITDAYMNEISGGGYPTAASYCADVPSHCASSAAVEYEHLPGSSRFSVLRRSEEHTSELQSLMRSSYAVFCLKKKKHIWYEHGTE